MSPYIVTTMRPDNQPFDPFQTNIWRPASRRAVATLDEARREVAEVTLPYALVVQPDVDRAVAAECWNLPEGGGMVGPLHDGTIIEVKRVALIDLVGDAEPVARGMATSQLLDAAPEIIAAFNANRALEQIAGLE